MRRILAMGAAIVICACSTGDAKTIDPQPPPLSGSEAEHLMLRADDVRRLAAAGTARLADAFRARALQTLQAQSQSLDRRGLRTEERNTARKLVFWDPRAGEAVLQVVAQRRLLAPDDPNPTWAGTVRQWWARLQYADGAWWVVEQADLTPDRWRPVPPIG